MPLSDSQISDVLDRGRAGCRFVTGLPIMGVRDFPTSIDQVLGPRRTWGKATDISIVTVTDSKACRRDIEQVEAAQGLKRTKRTFTKPSADQVSELVTFTDRWGQVRSGNVRPVFLLYAASYTTGWGTI